MTLFNKLILQIIISEIIDGISILLEIVRDSYGINYFEKYNSIKFFCFTQIYLSLFSCLWTLTASFFISLRLYDMTVKRNKIFHKKLLEKITPLISIAFSMILSFIIWSIQVSSQSKGRKNLSKEEFYNPERRTQNYKLMYCWVNNDLNIVISILVFILVAANIYFSLIKSMIFVNKVKRNMEENESVVDKKRINDIKIIKKSYISIL